MTLRVLKALAVVLGAGCLAPGAISAPTLLSLEQTIHYRMSDFPQTSRMVISPQHSRMFELVYRIDAVTEARISAERLYDKDEPVDTAAALRQQMNGYASTPPARKVIRLSEGRVSDGCGPAFDALAFTANDGAGRATKAEVYAGVVDAYLIGIIVTTSLPTARDAGADVLARVRAGLGYCPGS